MIRTIKKIVNFPKRKDWKGYNLSRKTWFLSLFTVKPIFAYEKFPEDFYRSFEIDRNELCKDKSTMDEVIKIKYSNFGPRVLMSVREMINLYNLASKAKDLEGDMAEVGVYQGGSAMIISRVKGEKPLHLFDTFEGLPEPDKRYDNNMVKGDMDNTSLDRVKSTLSGYNNIFLYKGYFPETATTLEDKKFCFVNNDTDIYSSTKSFLEYFYPRMVKGGIILTHDYNDTRTPGVRKAYDEFFSNRTENIVEIWDTQAYVIKA